MKASLGEWAPARAGVLGDRMARGTARQTAGDDGRVLGSRSAERLLGEELKTVSAPEAYMLSGDGGARGGGGGETSRVVVPFTFTWSDYSRARCSAAWR